MTGGDGTIVLTGATGFLGMELLARLLERTERPVVALVRAPDDAAATARLEAVLDTVLGPGSDLTGQATALAADLEQPRLGLSAMRHAALAEVTDTVVHCAASVRFDLPLDDARRINVAGARQMLDLAAAAPRLDRLVHVSTAYVAGDREGACFEHEGDVGQPHRNTYEQTKLEAEREVRASGLPAAILRPSIVVGDSRTGWTPSFNVIYWPLRAFARGLFPVVPGDPDARLDIVPVDTVADAMFSLATGERRVGAVHVTAGDAAVTAVELAQLACAEFDAPAPEFVAPGSAPEIEERAGAYLPYFRAHGTFDAERGRALGFVPPDLREYFARLMAYARESAWGRRPQPRWQLAERVASPMTATPLAAPPRAAAAVG